jgi:chromosome segregation ATPase
MFILNEEEITILTREFEKMGLLIKNLNDELKEHQNNSRDFKSQLNSYNKKISKIEDKLPTISKNYNYRINTCSELEKKVEHNKEIIRNYFLKWIALRFQKASGLNNKSNTVIDDEIKSLHEQIKYFKNGNSFLETRLKRDLIEVKGFEKKTKELQKELDKLKEAKQKVKKENIFVIGKIRRLKEKIKKLDSELNRERIIEESIVSSYTSISGDNVYVFKYVIYNPKTKDVFQGMKKYVKSGLNWFYISISGDLKPIYKLLNPTSRKEKANSKRYNRLNNALEKYNKYVKI